MSETWRSCPGCGLKHRARPEGTCPRCGVAEGGGGGPARTAVALSPEVAPEAGPLLETDTSDEARDPLPARWAGALMLANSALLWGELLWLGPFDSDETGRLLGGALDAFIGLSLVTGRTQLRRLAAVRALWGGVLFAWHLVTRDQPIAALCQLLFSGGLLWLLSRSESRPRARLALGASVAMLVVQVLQLRRG